MRARALLYLSFLGVTWRFRNVTGVTRGVIRSRRLTLAVALLARGTGRVLALATLPRDQELTIVETCPALRLRAHGVD